MSLQIFTEDACKFLKQFAQENKNKYQANSPWIEEFFSDNKITDPYEEFYELSEDQLPRLQYPSSDGQQYDVENTITFYGALKDVLTPSLASIPNLWTTLCHKQYSEYVLKKWTNAKGIDIISHFFATRAKSSLAYYNAVSRFWWAGYLSYDKSLDNPWELTSVLFSAQQIEKDLTDQPFSMNLQICHGLLRGLCRLQQDKGDACTTIFRNCCNHYLNRYGVVTVLDCLTADEVEQISYEYMKNMI